MRLSALYVLLFSLPLLAETASTLTLSPNVIPATTGSEFSVQLVFVAAAVEKPPVLGCLDVSVGYDPKAVQFLSARFPQSEVPLSDEERRPESLTSVHANNSGHVRLIRLSLGDAATEQKLAAGGPAPAAILQFRARTEGLTPLLLSMSMVCDTASNAIPVQVNSAFVVVSAPAPPPQ